MGPDLVTSACFMPNFSVFVTQIGLQHAMTSSMSIANLSKYIPVLLPLHAHSCTG